MDARAGSPPREEMIEVGGRSMPIRLWEGEVLASAGGWILVFRGLGLAAALAASSAALFPYDDRLGWLLLSSVLAALVPALVGAGVLCRIGSCRLAVLFYALGWAALLCYSAPPLFHVGRPYEMHHFTSQPILLMVIPAFLLPDLFAGFVVMRNDADAAFKLVKEPLAPLLGALRVRATGRILVAVGMAGLALVSAALAAFLAPGLALA